MSDGDTWISSFEAVKRLREANFQEAETTLTLWAEARHLRARAKWGRFADSFSEQEFPPEPLDQSDAKANGSWPDIPADFWYYVNRGGPGVKAHVEAGVFAARVVFDPHWDDESEHITLFGVTFHEGDLHDLLTADIHCAEPQWSSPRRASGCCAARWAAASPGASA